jgi:hypothetical protein
VQFGVLDDLGLDEQGGPGRVHAGRQPVHDHLPGGVLDAQGVVVMGGQGMPVGHEEQAFVFVLEPDPVFQDAVVMAQVKAARGAHAGENSIRVHEVSVS